MHGARQRKLSGDLAFVLSPKGLRVGSDPSRPLRPPLDGVRVARGLLARGDPASIPRTPLFAAVRRRSRNLLTCRYAPLPFAEIRLTCLRNVEIAGSETTPVDSGKQ